MYRSLILELSKWKNRTERLPLIVMGARQVGKTFLLRAFAEQEFLTHYYFNFESDARLRLIFDGDLNASRILNELSLFRREPLDHNALFIFDEIQECPRAISALKYFAEELPQVALVCAGSLLGVALSEESFPVGKVEYLTLQPFSFSEFLLGINDTEGHQAYSDILSTGAASPAVHTELWNQLKKYYVSGGLPRAIAQLADSKNAPLTHEQGERISSILNALRLDYFADFSKHSGKTNALHIRAVFENLAHQLGATQDLSTKRFSFSNVIARKKGYAALQHPIAWLVKSGLVTQVPIVNRAELPLVAFATQSTIKLYPFDLGLFAVQASLPWQAILQQDYGQSKGYFAETLVLQGIQSFKPFCWMEGQSEIEFLIVLNGEIVPIEVKSSTRTQAKSLSTFRKKYSPKRSIKFSNTLPLLDRETNILHLPLYLAWDVEAMVKKLLP